MGSKGSQTTTTSSSPNPTAMAAYNNILGTAQGVAGTPYTPYTGELVAGVNPQQSTGIANINSNWNYAQPYLQSAAGMATDAATPLTQAQIQQYMSPYTQDVVNSTQAQFNNQNEQQRQGVVGNAITQGALGGNREAIAESELANQQQLAQAPVISGLYNQAYTTGLNTALTEQQARAQGAYSLGNLGVSGENAALTGANAQVGAGTLQQSTQQAQDAAAYQQFVNQLAYPFQTTQWLAGIGTGVGSQMGGTGTTTAPGPNLTSQLLGAGTAGAGILGGTGAFGSAGWLTALMANGGAVGRASGGVAPSGPTTMPETPETLKLQQRQLLNGHRRVQMFPHGTPELPMPRGMMRTMTDSGTFHYDPRRIHEDDIHRHSSGGRENELLDLGPYSKDDVLKRLYGGEVPVAVVERHPDGTEVRAAIGTHTTADRQMAAMNRTKSPGHIVRIEDPRETIGHRLRAYGGRVPGFADGGAPMQEMPPTNGVGAVMAGTPYSSGVGWVPKMGIAHGSNAPKAPGVAPAPTGPSLADQAKEIGSLAKYIYNPTAANADQNKGAGLSASDENPSMYYRGGSVRRASGGVANLPFHVAPHFADGGSPYDTNYFDESFATPIRHDPESYAIASDPDAMSAYANRARGNVLAENPGYVPLPRRRPEGIAPAYDLPPIMTASRPEPQAAMSYSGEGSGPRSRSSSVPVVRGDQESPLDDAAWPHGPIGAPGTGYDSMASATPTPPRGVAPSGINFGADSKLWPSLMSAGFGMMASRSPFAGVAIGEGGMAGMQTYSNERQREDKINSEVKKLAQEAEFAQKRLDLATRPYSEQTVDQKAKSAEAKSYHEILGNRMQLRPTGTQTEDGHPIFIDGRTGQSFDGITSEPVAPDAKVVSASAAKVPVGYARNPDGTMTPIKGGPADPEVVAGLVKAKSGAQIPDATADFLAERVLNGDTKALIGMGRGAQGAENIIRIQGLVAQKAAERGMNAQDILAKSAEQSGLTASQRTFGTQIAKMAVNSTEAQGAIQQGLEVSQKVPRTKFVPINKLVQTVESNISDPDLLEFRAANLAIINTYARAISPTGTPTVHDKEEAMKVVSEATSPEAYDRVMHRMLKEIEIAHAAPAQAKKELERIRKSSSSSVEPSPVITTPGSRPTITTKEEFDKLPSGAEYIRNSNAYRKP